MKINKIAILILIAFFGLGIANFSFAQNPLNVENIMRERQSEISIQKNKLEQDVQSFNERRREMAMNLFERINIENEQMTISSLSYLEKIDDLVDRIKSKVDEVKESRPEIDISNVYITIDDAKTSIEESRKGVLEQKTKIYTIEIGSIAATRENFRSKIRELRNDVLLIREMILKSRQATQKTIDDFFLSMNRTTQERNETIRPEQIDPLD